MFLFFEPVQALALTATAASASFPVSAYQQFAAFVAFAFAVYVADASALIEGFDCVLFCFD